MSKMPLYTTVVLGLIALVTPVPAEEIGEPHKNDPIRVAVLDFAADAPGKPQFGAEVAELVAVRLGMTPGLELVERSALSRTLEEQSLNLSGLVHSDQAVKVGKLAGAQLLVVGRIFALGDKHLMTARLISTETSRVTTAMAECRIDEDPYTLTLKLADTLSQQFTHSARSLLPKQTDQSQRMAKLKEKLANCHLPKVAIDIPERHLSRMPALPDPAVATEMRKMLIECGIEITTLTPTITSGDKKLDADRALRSVDLLIRGEGLSEYAARIANMQTCSARVEIEIVDRATGAVLLSERVTTRGVDLSETIAAKTALQNAGHELSWHVLEFLASHFNRGE